MLAALLFAPAVAEARGRGPALPKSMLGAWSFEPGDCDPQSEGRLTVEPRLVLFYASAYGVRRIVKRRDGSLKIFGPRSDEGEGSGSTPDTIDLKLIAPDQLSAGGQVYHRCKAAAP